MSVSNKRRSILKPAIVLVIVFTTLVGATFLSQKHASREKENQILIGLRRLETTATLIRFKQEACREELAKYGYTLPNSWNVDPYRAAQDQHRMYVSLDPNLKMLLYGQDYLHKSSEEIANKYKHVCIAKGKKRGKEMGLAWLRYAELNEEENEEPPASRSPDMFDKITGRLAGASDSEIKSFANNDLMQAAKGVVIAETLSEAVPMLFDSSKEEKWDKFNEAADRKISEK